MNYSVIKTYDIANGPGVRISLFVSGCENNCKGCFQPETWDPEYGKKFTENTMKAILEYLKPKHIQGLSILGGDPFFPGNTDTILKIIDTVNNEYPAWSKNYKDIWVYTGYTIQNLCRRFNNTFFYKLHGIDWMVDGPFIEKEKNIGLQFRGSNNQRLIDIQKSYLITTTGNEFGVVKKLKIYHKNKLSDKLYIEDTIAL